MRISDWISDVCSSDLCTLDQTLHHHQSRIEIDALELEEHDIDAAHHLHALDQILGVERADQRKLGIDASGIFEPAQIDRIISDDDSLRFHGIFRDDFGTRNSKSCPNLNSVIP